MTFIIRAYRSFAFSVTRVCFSLSVFLLYIFLGSEYDEEEVDYEDSDSDESWTTESAISSEAILSSMCMNGGDEKPFACPVPGCKKRYKVSVLFMIRKTVLSKADAVRFHRFYHDLYLFRNLKDYSTLK